MYEVYNYRGMKYSIEWNGKLLFYKQYRFKIVYESFDVTGVWRSNRLQAIDDAMKQIDSTSAKTER